MIDTWINNGSGWIIESIELQYINISTYRPVAGNFYIDLPVEWKHPRKGLFHIKNKDEKCFIWFRVRHINPSKDHPGKEKMSTKKLLKGLIIVELNFL